jgi:DNA invertase Pin-like site-specific DNA recombinase
MAIKTDTVRVALYCRVSSQEQVEHGVSLSEQRERLQAWAKAEGWQIIDIYIDEGVSGGTDARPQLQNLLLDAKAGRFDLVAVTKIDRFFRNTRLLLDYIEMLKLSKVAFVAQAESIDTRKSGIGNIVLSLLGSVAEWEKERIGQRIQDFRQHLAAQGRWSSGRPPFGYRFNKEIKQLEIYELEAEAIRYAFEQFTGKESIGIIRLAERMNKAGYLPPVNSRKHRKHDYWTQTTARHIIVHPAYIGGPNDNWCFNTPAIIDVETWQAAQQRLSCNRHFKPSESGKTQFQGHLRCGLCGRLLRIGYNHSTTKVYECPGRLKREHLDGSHRCTLPRLNAEVIDNKIAHQIKAMSNDKSLFISYLSKTIDKLYEEKASLEARLKPLRAEADNIREEMTILDARIEMRRISPDVYKQRMEKCKSKLKEISEREGAADPLLLREIKMKEAEIENFAAYYEMTKYNFESVKNMFLKPVEMRGLPTDAFAKSYQEKQSSLFQSFIVYPERIELRGMVNLGKSNISSDYR